MKTLKIASMLIMAVFSLSMASGAFAADKCIEHNKSIEEKQITVKVNEKFNIKLESNPTTGYEWVHEFDLEFLKLISETYVPDKHDDFIVGSGGHDIFLFKAIKTGETDITMKYVKPWDNCLPAKEIIYHITITE